MDTYIKNILNSKRLDQDYLEQCAFHLFGLIERKLHGKFAEYYISKSNIINKYIERVLVEMDNVRKNLIKYWDGTKFERISKKSYNVNNYEMIFWSNIMLHVEYHSFIKTLFGLKPF